MRSRNGPNYRWDLPVEQKNNFHFLNVRLHPSVNPIGQSPPELQGESMLEMMSSFYHIIVIIIYSSSAAKQRLKYFRSLLGENLKWFEAVKVRKEFICTSTPRSPMGTIVKPLKSSPPICHSCRKPRDLSAQGPKALGSHVCGPWWIEVTSEVPHCVFSKQPKALFSSVGSLLLWKTPFNGINLTQIQGLNVRLVFSRSILNVI